MKEKLKEIIDRERGNIPEVNLKHYDAICESYVSEILKRPAEFECLAKTLWERIQMLKQRSMHYMPPLLCRMQGEVLSDYLERIYSAAGYSHIEPVEA